MKPDHKIMFEIYRDLLRTGEFRAVYYTELDDHNRDAEINRAAAGEHVYDGFLALSRAEAGKRTVEDIIARMNAGEKIDAAAIAHELSAYAAA